MEIETDQELLQIYFEEAEEHIQCLVQCILDMESSGTDSRALDETYRMAHSLKGSSGMVGFTEIARIAHLMEDLFDALRANEIEFDNKLADLLLRSTDAIKDCLTHHKVGDGKAPNIEPLFIELQGVMKLLQHQEKTDSGDIFQQMSAELIAVMTEQDANRIEKAREQNENIYEILLYLKKDTFMEDIRVVNRTLQNIGQILVKNRATETLNSDCDILLKILFVSTSNSNYIGSCLNGIQHTIRKLEWDRNAIIDSTAKDVPVNKPSELSVGWEQDNKAKSFEVLRKQYVSDSLEKLQRSVNLILRMEKNPSDEEVLEELFRIFHSFKGSGSGYKFPEISDLAHEAESILEQVRDSQIAVTASVTDKLLQSTDKLNTILRKAEEPKSVSGTEYKKTSTQETSRANIERQERDKVIKEMGLTSSSNRSGGHPESKSKSYTSEETLRVNVKKIDELVNISSEILVRRDSERQVLQELRYSAQLMRQLVRTFNKTKDEMKLEPNLRELLDNGPLAKMFSETGQKLISLHERIGRLQEAVTDGATKTESLASELQSKVMNVRMMPISTIFQKFQRLVRELSCTQAKKIRLEIKGENNELDKKVLEEIGDPLVHLIRNSVDHGIETPDERISAGKPQTGTIRLEAVQVGNHMIIEVEDDGNGINPERIRQSAVRKGIVAEEIAKELSKQELLDLMFTPAFSTKENVTQISGRGVGLDVVKTNVEKLNGSIEIDTEVGRGTKFSLRIPITLAIVRVLVINVGGLLFAVPAGVTERIQKINEDELISVDGQQVILSHGQPLPSVKLSELLGLETNGKTNVACTGLIFSSVGRLVCLIVDKVECVQDVVLKNLGILLKNVPHVGGGCIMRDGEIVIILDILSLARQVLYPNRRPRDSRHFKSSKPKLQKVVMVVEDSLIARDMLTSILLASGYKVLEAADGVEALSKLRRQHCDLIVTDIIMPNMTGFELTQAIRIHKSLSNLPVIMVTNKEKEEDRLRGMQVGADAYIVKSRFDQKNLLSTIDELLKTN